MPEQRLHSWNEMIAYWLTETKVLNHYSLTGLYQNSIGIISGLSNFLIYGRLDPHMSSSEFIIHYQQLNMLHKRHELSLILCFIITTHELVQNK